MATWGSRPSALLGCPAMHGLMLESTQSLTHSAERSIAPHPALAWLCRQFLNQVPFFGIAPPPPATASPAPPPAPLQYMRSALLDPSGFGSPAAAGAAVAGDGVASGSRPWLTASLPAAQPLLTAGSSSARRALGVVSSALVLVYDDWPDFIKQAFGPGKTIIYKGKEDRFGSRFLMNGFYIPSQNARSNGDQFKNRTSQVIYEITGALDFHWNDLFIAAPLGLNNDTVDLAELERLVRDGTADVLLDPWWQRTLAFIEVEHQHDNLKPLIVLPGIVCNVAFRRLAQKLNLQEVSSYEVDCGKYKLRVVDYGFCLVLLDAIHPSAGLMSEGKNNARVEETYHIAWMLHRTKSADAKSLIDACSVDVRRRAEEVAQAKVLLQAALADTPGLYDKVLEVCGSHLNKAGYVQALLELRASLPASFEAFITAHGVATNLLTPGWLEACDRLRVSLPASFEAIITKQNVGSHLMDVGFFEFLVLNCSLGGDTASFFLATALSRAGFVARWHIMGPFCAWLAQHNAWTQGMTDVLCSSAGNVSRIDAIRRSEWEDVCNDPQFEAIGLANGGAGRRVQSGPRQEVQWTDDEKTFIMTQAAALMKDKSRMPHRGWDRILESGLSTGILAFSRTAADLASLWQRERRRL